MIFCNGKGRGAKTNFDFASFRWLFQSSQMTPALDWLPMISRIIPRLATDTCNFELFNALS